MDNNIKKYEIMQEGRKYYLSSEIHENCVRITCIEIYNKNSPMFIGDFSLKYLRKLSTKFNSTLTIQDAQNLVNKTIENQKLRIENKNGSINVLLYLQNKNENAIFTLKPNSKGPVQITYSPPKYLPVKKVYHPPVYIKRPTIHTNGNDNYINLLELNNIYETQVSEIENITTNHQTDINNDISNIVNIENGIQQNINYNYAPLGSPKREQIEYFTPSSPSKAKYNYTAISSHRNNSEQQNNKSISSTNTSNNSNVFNIQKVIELQNETNKIKGEHELLKAETNKLIEQIQLLNNQIQILTEENKNLRQSKGAIPKENEIHEITLLKQEVERLTQELNNLQNEKNNENEEYKKIKENQIEVLTKRLNEVIEENNNLKLQIQQLLNNNNLTSTNSQNIVIQRNYDEQLKEERKLEVVKGEIIENNDELGFLISRISRNNKKMTLTLLYKATADSDRAEVFHNKCDKAKSTLVLIKSGNEKRFGGFTSCDWSGESIEKKDDNAFIFSLDKMKIYDIIPGNNAIGCYTKFGPVFLGYQIKIYNEAFTNGGTTYLKGVNYNTEEDFELTDGLQNFEVKEIEVYNVEFK